MAPFLGALSWFNFGPDDITYEKQPENYIPLIQKFQTKFSFEG